MPHSRHEQGAYAGGVGDHVGDRLGLGEAGVGGDQRFGADRIRTSAAAVLRRRSGVT